MASSSFRLEVPRTMAPKHKKVTKVGRCSRPGRGRRCLPTSSSCRIPVVSSALRSSSSSRRMRVPWSSLSPASSLQGAAPPAFRAGPSSYAPQITEPHCLFFRKQASERTPAPTRPCWFAFAALYKPTERDVQSFPGSSAVSFGSRPSRKPRRDGSCRLSMALSLAQPKSSRPSRRR